jgi:hypothetical protein
MQLGDSGNAANIAGLTDILLFHRTLCGGILLTPQVKLP